MNKASLTSQIYPLLNDYASLQALSKYDDLSDLPGESKALVIRLLAAIHRLVPPSSTYAKEADALAGGGLHARVSGYAGILTALRADLEAGWFEGILELLHSETHSDFLDQANELLDKNYKDAAAVIVGSTLESHLRLLGVKCGLAGHSSSRGSQKADTINAELKKAGAYGPNQQKLVTAWLGIRNSAAHGNYDEYESAEVRLMMNSVREFITAHPA